MSGSQPAADAPAEVGLFPTPAPEPAATPAVADTTATPTTTPSETPATSLNAEGDTPTSLLEVTKKVLKEAGEPPAPDATKSEVTTPAEGTQPKAPDGTEAADADLPFHTHPRWIERQAEIKNLRSEVAAYKPEAEMHRQTLEFMAKNDLKPEDVRTGFAIMAALRKDPATAYAMLEPTIRDLRLFLGKDLPTDLREKVDAGAIDEETAAETARLRNETSFRQAAATREQEARVVQQSREAGNATASAVDQWVLAQSGQDPDFARVNPLLEGAVRALQAQYTAQGIRFDNPAAAVKLTEQAYRNVKGHLASLVPARPAIKPLPGSNATATGAIAKPGSMLEAVRQALDGTYQA